MRRSAVINTAQGLGRHDHVGWAFDDPAEFQAHAGRFLAEGLAARERVMYVAGAGTPYPIGVDALDAALADGQAQVTSVVDMYGLGEPVEPERQVTIYTEATEQALADGWTGLRVAADGTSLVLTETQREAWVRYEHLIDAYMTRMPMSALCGFHRTAVDRTALAEVTCVHPVLNARSSEFRFYAAPGTGTDLTLAGEIDPGNRDVLANVLRHVRPQPHDGRLVVDARLLAFVDHHALAELADYAAAMGATAVVQAEESSVLTTIARLVPMSNLEVLVVSS